MHPLAVDRPDETVFPLPQGTRHLPPFGTEVDGAKATNKFWANWVVEEGRELLLDLKNGVWFFVFLQLWCFLILHNTWKCANCFQFSSHAFRVYSALVHTNIPRELYGQKSGLVLNITLGCLNLSTISPCNTSTFSKDPCRLETKISCIIWFIVLQSTPKKRCPLLDSQFSCHPIPRSIHPMPYVLRYDASTGAPNMRVSRASNEARVVQYGDAETNGAEKSGTTSRPL